MSEPVKYPSARHPAVYQDQFGNWLFTRVWFLFFQALYIRSGGSLASDIDDLNDFAPPGGGTGPDIEYMLQTFIQGIDQGPRPDVYSVPTVDDVAPAISQLRDELAEMRRMINSLQQGTTIL